MAFDFKSTGARIGDRLHRALLEQEISRRQSLLDGLAIRSQLAEEARFENAARRQAQQDMLDADERAKRDLLTEREYNDEQARQKVLDQRYESEQKQRNMDRADAAATRYQDAELRRQEQEAERDFRTRESAAQRANARDIAGINMSGRGSGDKMTEGQRKTEGLLSRAQSARATADKLEGSVSTIDLLAPNFLRSEKGQQYRQAAKQWIQSVLRDESGAAIGADEEGAYFETYFRQPGDTAAVIRQKQEARDAG